MDPRFEQYVTLCQNQLKLQLSLKDDLLKPVQRIMRVRDGDSEWILVPRRLLGC